MRGREVPDGAVAVGVVALRVSPFRSISSFLFLSTLLSRSRILSFPPPRRWLVLLRPAAAVGDVLRIFPHRRRRGGWDALPGVEPGVRARVEEARVQRVEVAARVAVVEEQGCGVGDVARGGGGSGAGVDGGVDARAGGAAGVVACGTGGGGGGFARVGVDDGRVAGVRDVAEVSVAVAVVGPGRSGSELRAEAVQGVVGGGGGGDGGVVGVREGGGAAAAAGGGGVEVCAFDVSPDGGGGGGPGGGGVAGGVVGREGRGGAGGVEGELVEQGSAVGPDGVAGVGAVLRKLLLGRLLVAHLLPPGDGLVLALPLVVVLV